MTEFRDIRSGFKPISTSKTENSVTLVIGGRHASLVSTIGTPTLADDLLQLSPHLVEYVIVHELLHLKVPAHSKVYRLLLSQYVPDWQSYEEQLGYIVGKISVTVTL